MDGHRGLGHRVHPERHRHRRPSEEIEQSLERRVVDVRPHVGRPALAAPRLRLEGWGCESGGHQDIGPVAVEVSEYLLLDGAGLDVVYQIKALHRPAERRVNLAARLQLRQIAARLGEVVRVGGSPCQPSQQQRSRIVRVRELGLRHLVAVIGEQCAATGHRLRKMFVRPTHGQRKVLRHNDSELPRVGARPGGGKGHVVGHHAQHQCAVGNRGGKRPVLAHLEPAVAAELAGHHSEAGLETEQSAIGGRDADRAEAVVPVRQLDLPAGHRRSRSTGRAAWGSRRVPRVACHGLLVVGGPPQAQLGYGGEADDHCARGS